MFIKLPPICFLFFYPCSRLFAEYALFLLLLPEISLPWSRLTVHAHSLFMILHRGEVFSALIFTVSRRINQK